MSSFFFSSSGNTLEFGGGGQPADEASKRIRDRAQTSGQTEERQRARQAQKDREEHRQGRIDEAKEAAAVLAADKKGARRAGAGEDEHTMRRDNRESQKRDKDGQGPPKKKSRDTKQGAKKSNVGKVPSISREASMGVRHIAWEDPRDRGYSSSQASAAVTHTANSAMGSQLRSTPHNSPPPTEGAHGVEQGDVHMRPASMNRVSSAPKAEASPAELPAVPLPRDACAVADDAQGDEDEDWDDLIASVLGDDAGAGVSRRRPDPATGTLRTWPRPCGCSIHESQLLRPKGR